MEQISTLKKKMNILVVDDEASVCQSVDKILARRGFDVEQALSAPVAIDNIKSGKQFDLIIADLMMPQVSGMELLKVVRQTAPEMPFLMITGYPSISTAVEATKLGAAGFIPKPFTPGELEEAVEKALSDLAKAQIADPLPPTGDIDVDMPFDAREVARATSPEFVENLTRSDVPMVHAPARRPAMAADFCPSGQRSCKKFVKQGECKGVCPFVVAEQKKASLTRSLTDTIVDPMDVDMPFSFSEVAAATSPAYAMSLGASDMPVVGHYRQAQAQVQSPRVLVVDDEAVVVNSVRRTLSRRGYAIEEVFSGKDALSRIAAEAFDLVLLDMKLGDMNGLDLLPRIKKLRPGMPVVMVTGFASLDTAVDAVKRGADDYMAKPFTPEEIFGVTAKALKRYVA